jgi:seryl-tRNA synthetase
MDYFLLRLPNILHHSVPKGIDENDNITVFEWGKIPEHDFPIKDHVTLGLNLDLMDFKRAAKVSGARFYYLKNEGVTIDFALMNFAIAEMREKGYTPIEPPFMMRKKSYEGVTAFSDFYEVLYKIENEDLYLIATSEHPIAAMYMDEVINEKDLPLRFVGVSPCFRKEAGAHGKDTKGIFRTHQFNKVEQFVFCKPEDSWKIHEELIDNVKAIYKKLELPFRVVNVCTGDIGTVAAKKYDLEVWMSAQQKFREVVSCSNCTDYQARRLNIRFRETEGRLPKGFVHTLNSTAIATGRTIVAILENFQEKNETIIVPNVLRPLMNGKKKIG